MSRSQPLPTFATVAEFEAWAETQPDCWELHDGVPVAIAPERANHVRIKARVWSELDRALQNAGSPCEAFRSVDAFYQRTNLASAPPT